MFSLSLVTDGLTVVFEMYPLTSLAMESKSVSWLLTFHRPLPFNIVLLITVEKQESTDERNGGVSNYRIYKSLQSCQSLYIALE